MPKKRQPEFKMRMDTGGAESLYAEERQDLKLEKLAQKVTIMSILIPVLIGIILVISYLDIKSRVSTVKNTGESGVQSLSQNLESRFSSLSVKYASLEEDVKRQAAAAEKARQTLQKKLNEAEKSVRWLNKIKAAKKSVDKKNSAIEAGMAAIRVDLQTLDANLNSLDQAVKNELEALVALVEKSESSILNFQSQLTGKIDRDETEKILGKQKKEVMAGIDAMGLRLEKQIVLNRQRIAEVKKKTATVKPKKVSKPSAGKAGASKPITERKPAPAREKEITPGEPAPKPGEIVEQDL